MNRELTRTNNPFAGMMTLHDAVNQLLSESLVRPTHMTSNAPWVPLDVYEAEQGYSVRLAVPGLKPDNFEITVQQETLSVRGRVEAETPENATYLVRERMLGDFTRTMQFPSPINVEGIEAHLEHGLLKINVPKAEAARPRRITVTGN